MKHIKFNKTICGVDFLLNVLELRQNTNSLILGEWQSADFFQIVFVEKGKGKLQLDEQNITLENHMVLFISENQKYRWDVQAEDLQATILIFQEDFLNEFFSDKYFTFRLLYFYQTELPLKVGISPDLEADYLHKLREIKIELENPESDSVHIIRSILYYILIQLNRTYARQQQINTAITNDNIAYEFRRLVEQHIVAKQRVAEYAALMKVSRITLNKAVKKHFNITCSEFLKARLTYEIKMQLLFSNHTIEALAQIFHFSEPNHLSRFFKSQTGESPSEYRLAYQNGRN
ncbi:AraC family transcriptional regulator [Persicobacter sp. CCB-QB2]|uniref:AraC family transcriptional regulator n=1 Tax=Persicobacter sp. CCB-QB2 TaxID=1561025 RepID=UPI0006A946B7|nr:AraC family transcriptional regulator [Persicobacter sp. CCB-QB2]